MWTFRILFLLIILTGCAGLTFDGTYNPSKVSTDKLAKIGHGKSFKELFMYSGTHSVVAVNDIAVPSSGSWYTRIEPGVNTIDWHYSVTEDLGIATYQVVKESGRLVVNLKPSNTYTIGVDESGDYAVKVWNRETQEVVSTTCLTDCKQEKSSITGVPILLSK